MKLEPDVTYSVILKCVERELLCGGLSGLAAGTGPVVRTGNQALCKKEHKQVT